MAHPVQLVLTRPRLYAGLFAITTIVFFSVPGTGQYSGSIGATAGYTTGQTVAAGNAISGSVPSDPASNEVLHLTLRDAINSALKYNLGSIESGEDTRIARGQRLIALSQLLPQVGAGVSETVQQENLATFGLKLPGVPAIIGPYSYSSVQASASQTLFSYESIQRFRSARTAEQAAKLSYQDILDAVTLTVGNAYLQVIADSSHIDAQDAQVQNAKALYDQAVDAVQAGTAPKIDVTRTEVQLHTEEYNLSVRTEQFCRCETRAGSGHWPAARAAI